MTGKWYVYILRCRNKTFYTGITTDLERRVAEHNLGKSGASKYTRAHRPVSLVYHETAKDRSSAAKREAAIKKLTRQEKQDLINTKSSR